MIKESGRIKLPLFFTNLDARQYIHWHRVQEDSRRAFEQLQETVVEASNIVETKPVEVSPEIPSNPDYLLKKERNEQRSIRVRFGVGDFVRIILMPVRRKEALQGCNLSRLDWWLYGESNLP